MFQVNEGVPLAAAVPVTVNEHVAPFRLKVTVPVCTPAVEGAVKLMVRSASPFSPKLLLVTVKAWLVHVPVRVWLYVVLLKATRMVLEVVFPDRMVPMSSVDDTPSARARVVARVILTFW